MQQQPTEGLRLQLACQRFVPSLSLETWAAAVAGTRSAGFIHSSDTLTGQWTMMLQFLICRKLDMNFVPIIGLMSSKG